MDDLNLLKLARISDEEAWELVEKLRWNGKPVCPHCGNDERPYLLEKTSGWRTTKAGNPAYRRVWKCGACRKQFSALVGTIFHGTHIPLGTWLTAIHMMCAGKNGVSAHELHRQLGVTYKTAWFLCHRIREAMKRPPLVGKLAGIVEADETYIGGQPRAGQIKDRKERRMWAERKAKVVTLVERDGEARSYHVANVTGETVGTLLSDNVGPDTRLMTDGHHVYRKPGSQFPSHEWVEHRSGEYARGDVTTNTVEGFFAQFKTSLDGTYHHVSQAHLHRYLAEFDYRYSTRKMSDGERTVRAIQQAAGRRLKYQTPASE
ncbi:MAG TPA: IS1595 family transposase [Acidimicrobiia bacterium]|nr:IS1595 family transposase [Acidimicrobiia bacterium]